MDFEIFYEQMGDDGGMEKIGQENLILQQIGKLRLNFTCLINNKCEAKVILDKSYCKDSYNPRVERRIAVIFRTNHLARL